jgi:UDP-N-acetyl-D-glucosamine dehydrogenase
VKWNRPTIAAFDLVLISTAHDAVNYKNLADWARLIVDTRNVMAKIKTRARGVNDKVWKA